MRQANQQGAVLIIALILVVAVTGAAVTLMSSSTTDTKIVNAAQESDDAHKSGFADSEKAIHTQRNLPGNDNNFLKVPAQFPNDGTGFDVTPPNANSNVRLTNLNQGPDLLDCPPIVNVTAGIKCNMLQMRTQVDYGKSDRHNVVVNTGITQEMGAIAN